MTEPTKHQHYSRDISNLKKLDIYRFLELYDVDNAVGHAIKNLALAGERGAKSFRKDIEEAIDTLQRRLEMLDEDMRTQHKLNRESK